MSMELKPVPGFDNCLINEDGTKIIFNGVEYKRVWYSNGKGRDRSWCIHVKSKKYFVAKLVHRTWVKPGAKHVKYKDGDKKNTHYTNLLPQLADMDQLKKDHVRLKQVPGYPDLWINKDGKIVVQDGFIRVPRSRLKNRIGPLVFEVSVTTKKDRIGTASIARLVALAYLKNPLKHNLVGHRDGDTKNNHYRNLIWATPKEIYYLLLARGKFKLNNYVGHSAIDYSLIDTEGIKKDFEQGMIKADLVKKYGISVSYINRVLKDEL